jgi:hypothetical protein
MKRERRRGARREARVERGVKYVCACTYLHWGM